MGSKVTTLRTKPVKLNLSNDYEFRVVEDCIHIRNTRREENLLSFPSKEWKRIGEFFTLISKPDLTGDLLKDAQLLLEWEMEE